MPLIWNDEKYRWVGDDEPYDTLAYSVVRKLYVELTPASTPLTSLDISRIFARYGPLENVELRHSGERKWAFITFCNDKDACVALIMEPNEDNPMIANIQPARTWKQPPNVHNETSPNSNEPSLLTLNDDCLLKVFEFCDLQTRAILWQVCWKTRNLLEEFVLPKVTEYAIEFGDNGAPAKRLKRVHDELQCIGPHIKRLRLSQVNLYKEPFSFEFYLQQCSKYVGASINELRIDEMPFEIFTDRNSKLLQPLLLQIEILYIRFPDEAYWGEPLHFLAPKLKSLTAYIPSSNNNFSDHEDKLAFLDTRFPKLEKLVLRVRLVIHKIQTFLSNHTQLKYLQMDNMYYTSLPRVIARTSTNLEELVIHDVLFYNDDEIWPLRNCEKLEKLVLHNCGKPGFNESLTTQLIYSNLRELKNLRSIMVTVYNDASSKQSELFANFGREIPQLEHFYTDFVLSLSTIIQFIGSARHLKSFCVAFDQTECSMSIDVVKALVDARKSLFRDCDERISTLEVVLFPPDGQTAHPNIELDAEMAKYVTLSFEKSSAEKYFDPELMDRSNYAEFYQP